MKLDVLGIIGACSYALDCVESELIHVTARHAKRVAYMSVCTAETIEPYQHCPDIGAGLRDNQHSNHWDCLGEKHPWNVEAKTKRDRQPQKTELTIVILTDASECQHDYQKSQQRKRNTIVQL